MRKVMSCESYFRCKHQVTWRGHVAGRLPRLDALQPLVQQLVLGLHLALPRRRRLRRPLQLRALRLQLHGRAGLRHRTVLG